ncbi:unnamed protein product [Closterium sp. Yama58-4]|nr:unnamed protein product [Closterium sp. Yama58-4]
MSGEEVENGVVAMVGVVAQMVLEVCGELQEEGEEEWERVEEIAERLEEVEGEEEKGDEVREEEGEQEEGNEGEEEEGGLWRKKREQQRHELQKQRWQAGQQGRDVRACQAMLLSFLDQLIAQHPLLLRLLTFQGFSLTCVPPLVAASPATRSLLPALARELLQQPIMSRQLMAVALVAEYAVCCSAAPDALPLASHVLHLLANTLTHTAASTDFLSLSVPPAFPSPLPPNPRQVLHLLAHTLTHTAAATDFLSSTLPSAVRCAVALPALTPATVTLLRDCIRVAGPLLPHLPPQVPVLFAAAEAAWGVLVRSLTRTASISLRFLQLS